MTRVEARRVAVEALREGAATVEIVEFIDAASVDRPMWWVRVEREGFDRTEYRTAIQWDRRETGKES